MRKLIPIIAVLWGLIAFTGLSAQQSGSGGGVFLPLTGGTLTGSLTATTLFSQQSVAAGTNNAFYWTTISALTTPADGVVRIMNVGTTFGIEIDAGTAAPTLGTCTGGALTAGSRNSVGEVTGTTGGSCIVQFAANSFTNTPFCEAQDETAGGIVNVTARSTASFTVSNITSGHAFQWLCFGRV